MNVLFETTKGNFTITLDSVNAPISTANFVNYVKKGHYDGTIFHRVIPGFMVQGGGFTADMKQKPTDAPIKNEATNGLKNKRGTVAMARTGVVDSATCQFFVNVVDNGFLDHKTPDQRGYGYAVVGQVTAGMDVLDEIVKVPSTSVAGHENVPREAITVTKASLAEA